MSDALGDPTCVRLAGEPTVTLRIWAVGEDEPQVHPGLLGREDVVLLPHVGSATVETRTAMADLAVANVLAVLAGGEPVTPVGG